jgi:succinylglutamate desuccinylase
MESGLMTTLHEQFSLPESLLSAQPCELEVLFPEPLLVHLSGAIPEPLFVSVLLHGNEPTGFYALQQLLQKYAHKPLPRALSFFLGNTRAAACNQRRLENQPDFNRIWPGTALPESPETRMAAKIVSIMQQKRVFASIDIHNNTGLNPHYACINCLDNPFLQLANVFGRLTVFFNRPLGVQSLAFSKICPAVTVECGKPGQQYGIDHAFEYLNSCLNLSQIPTHPVHSSDIDVYHTVAQIKIKPDIRFSFTQDDADLLLVSDLEKMNFTEVPASTDWGQVKFQNALPLMAENEMGQDVTEQFFELQDQRLMLRKPAMPSMLTLDERIIRQDCLCYLMEKVSL